MSSCAYLNSAGVVVLSRPMQKKIISLISCQLVTESGRGQSNSLISIVALCSKSWKLAKLAVLGVKVKIIWMGVKVCGFGVGGTFVVGMFLTLVSYVGCGDVGVM